MTGAAAAGGGASAASSGGSGPSAAGGSSSGSSFSGASFGSASGNSQGQSGKSSSQANTYTLQASQALDLSQASFPTRGNNGEPARSTTPSESSTNSFADLAIPRSLAEVVAALRQPRDHSEGVRHSQVRSPAMVQSVEGERMPEAPRRSFSPREGASRAERGVGADTSERSPEAQSGKQTQRSTGMGVEQSDLTSAAFSRSLSAFRAQGEGQSNEQPNDRKSERKRDEPFQEEDELTKHYQKILNNLVESNMVSEDVASIARGKKGHELAAAVGVVMAKAAEQVEEAARERAQRGAEAAERGALQSSSSQSQNDWTQSKAA